MELLNQKLNSLRSDDKRGFSRMSSESEPPKEVIPANLLVPCEELKVDTEIPTVFSFDGMNISFEPLPEYTFTRTLFQGKLRLYGLQKGNRVYLPPQVEIKWLSLCKSNLQKCIRQRDGDRAVRTAFGFYSLSREDLFRRLPIIMIEDTLPHPPSFLKLIWWMCATASSCPPKRKSKELPDEAPTKDYLLTVPELEQLAGIILLMCDSTKYEYYNSRFSSPVSKGSIQGERVVHPLKDPLQSAFIWVLGIRAQMGGLWVDQKMLMYHQCLWSERFMEDSQGTGVSKGWWNYLLRQTSYLVDFTSIDTFTRHDVVLQGIDYHPFPWLLNNLSSDPLIQEKAKLGIWVCWSRCNVRKPLAAKGPDVELTPEDPSSRFFPPSPEVQGLYDAVKDVYETRVRELYQRLKF